MLISEIETVPTNISFLVLLQSYHLSLTLHCGDAGGGEGSNRNGTDLYAVFDKDQTLILIDT